MDRAAESVSLLLGWREVDMAWAGLGNMNYCFVATGPGGARVFVKSFASRLNRPGRTYRSVERRYQTEKEVLAACTEAGLPVPRTIATSDNNNLLVQEYIGGRDAQQYLTDNGDLDSLVTGIGLWLAVFHDLSSGDHAPTTADRFLQGARNSLQQTGRDIPLPVTKGLQGRTWPSVLCRNDCHLGNFLIATAGLVGIDFEMCSPGLRGLELGSAFAHTALGSLGDPERSADAVTPTRFARSFGLLLDAYNELAAISESDLRLFISVALVRLAARRVSETDALLKAAEEWSATL